MATAAAPAKRTVTVDFEGVEAGGGSIHIPEGDYGLKITKAVLKKGKESGKDNIRFLFKVIKGNSKGVGKTISHNCSLQKQSLWNLRNLIESAGKQVPSKAIKLDLDKMVGWELACTVVDDEYNGKKKSSIGGFFPMADLSPEKKEEEAGESEEGEAEETEAEEGEAGGTEEGGEEEELFE
jgi:uncharacterized protein DUF669